MLARGHGCRDVVQAADLENLFRVGGDDQRVKTRGPARPIVYPGKHGTTAERSQQLARQPNGFEVRRDHAQYFAHLCSTKGTPRRSSLARSSSREFCLEPSGESVRRGVALAGWSG